jgi:hypothetical protein
MPPLKLIQWTVKDLYCVICNKIIDPAKGKFCFECGACVKCCEHAICKGCNGTVNEKGKFINEGLEEKELPALCPHCEQCPWCCTCVMCNKCGRLISHKSGRCTVCGLCWECCEHLKQRLTYNGYNFRTLEFGMMNFYVLSELSALATAMLADEMKMIRMKVEASEVEELRDQIVTRVRIRADEMALVYKDYLVSACFGEMRHLCRRTGCDLGIDGFCGSLIGRHEAISRLKEYDSKKGLMLFEILFCHQNFTNGFGGKLWSKICEAGLMYYDPAVPKDVFLDHVVDLTHNGGLFLDKTAEFFTSTPNIYIAMLDLKRDLGLLQARMPLGVSERTKKFISQAQRLKLITGPVSEIYIVEPKFEHKLIEGKKVPILALGHCRMTKERMNFLIKDNFPDCGWEKRKEEFWNGVDEKECGPDMVGNTAIGEDDLVEE